MVKDIHRSPFTMLIEALAEQRGLQHGLQDFRAVDRSTAPEPCPAAPVDVYSVYSVYSGLKRSTASTASTGLQPSTVYSSPHPASDFTRRRVR